MAKAARIRFSCVEGPPCLVSLWDLSLLCNLIPQTHQSGKTFHTYHAAALAIHPFAELPLSHRLFSTILILSGSAEATPSQGLPKLLELESPFGLLCLQEACAHLQRWSKTQTLQTCLTSWSVNSAQFSGTLKTLNTMLTAQMKG